MKIKINILIFIFLPFFSISQTQIPEGGFDNWAQSGSYEEPSGGWWTSLNSLKSLGGPVTVTKTTDVHSGAYAARLETKTWGSFILPGLLVSGIFTTSAPFIIQGKPFTDKPLRFKGYYKYTSVNSDSAAIFAMISKHNSVSGVRDTIAVAKQAVLSSTSVYTPFDLEFVYSSSDTPDSIDVVFSSSANGANFSGQVGSTLIIDDIVLDYGAGVEESVFSEINLLLYPNPSNEFIMVNIQNELNSALQYTIQSLDGKMMEKAEVKGNQIYISTKGYKAGKYIINIYSGNEILGSKKFILL